MRKRSAFTIPAAAAGVIALGLTIGAALPTQGVGTPTPTSTIPAVLQVAIEEDDPRWNCETQGNRICGNLTEAQRTAAWEIWDAAGGAAQLIVDPHAKVTLTGYSLLDPYAQGSPELGIHQLALPGAEVWFIFTTERL